MVMWECGFGVPKGKVLGFEVHSQNYALSAASSQALCWALGIGKWISTVSAFREFTVSCGQSYLSRWSLCSSRRGTRCGGSTAPGQEVKVSKRTLQSGWVWSRGQWRVCKIDKKTDHQGRGTVCLGGNRTWESNPEVGIFGFHSTAYLSATWPNFLLKRKKENWGSPCPPPFCLA